MITNEVSLKSTARAICVKKDETFIAVQKSYKIFASMNGEI